MTFLYICHHLRRSTRSARRVTVLRDARHILTDRCRELTNDDLVQAMTGEAALMRAGQHAGRAAAPDAPRSSK